MYRQNNTLYSATTTPIINLTYIPTEGPDGNLTINADGDLETKSLTEMLPFLCQFPDGKLNCYPSFFSSQMVNLTFKFIIALKVWEDFKTANSFILLFYVFKCPTFNVYV